MNRTWSIGKFECRMPILNPAGSLVKENGIYQLASQSVLDQLLGTVVLEEG